MIKRTVAIILSGILIVGMVGCTNKTEEANDATPMTVEARESLPGEWSQDYTREEVTELHNEILTRVEETAAYYGLDYEVTEEVKEDTNGITINDNHVNIDIEDPEPNRLESMYYGFKQFGSDLASGQICMKLGFNLDKESIIEIGEFNIEELSLSAYSAAFTGDYDRDYTELNKEIYDIIEGKDGISSVENNLDGIKETVTITDNFLLYKLETKEYKFK